MKERRGNMQNYTDFGIQARTIMLRKDITMTEVASHLGVSVSYVSDIMRGGRRGEKQRKKIVEFLGMERGEFDENNAEVTGIDHGKGA